MSLFTELSKENTAILANELGIHPVELDRLNFNIYYIYDQNDHHTGYEFCLIGDNPMEISGKVSDLDGQKVLLPASLFEEDDEDWYEYQYDSSGTPEDNLKVFIAELDSLSKLNQVMLETKPLTAMLKRQIYIGIVGSLETYLSDTFIDLVHRDQRYLRKFVETYPEFNKRKFEMKDIFGAYEDLSVTAKNVMLDVIYHDLVKVREMYIKTFDVVFPSIREPMKCVKIRHDLVHRNGKTKDQRFITVNQTSINSSMEVIKSFVLELAEKIRCLQEDNDDFPF